MASLNIRSDERVTLVGKTGSGKTYMARQICKRLKRLVVFDPKGTLAVPNWRLEDWTPEGVKRLGNDEAVRLRVPAPITGNWEPYLTTCFSIGDLAVYLDEVYGMVPPGTKPSNMLTALYTRGRELNIGVIAATQRPSWVPMFILSEAEWIFVFRLQLEVDRKRMVEIGGPRLSTPISSRDPYGFWYYNTQWDYPEYSEGLD